MEVPINGITQVNNLSFDGTLLWVIGPGANTVNGINPQNGTVSKSISVPLSSAGDTPIACVSDGNNLCVYIVNNNTNSPYLNYIQVISISTGTKINTIENVGSSNGLGSTGLIGMAYCSGLLVYQYDFSDAAEGAITASSIETASGTPMAGGITGFEGAAYSIIVTQNNIIITDGEGVYVWNRQFSSGTTFNLSNITYGAAFDGTNLYVCTTNAIPNVSSGSVYQINLNTLTVGAIYGVGASSNGAVFDGQNLWVSDTGSNTIRVIQASTGATVATLSTRANPGTMAFDGTNVWVYNTGESVNTLTRF